MKRTNKNVRKALFKIELTQKFFVTFDTLDTNLLQKYRLMITFEKQRQLCHLFSYFHFFIEGTLYPPPCRKSSAHDVNVKELLPIKEMVRGGMQELTKPERVSCVCKIKYSPKKKS